MNYLYDYAMPGTINTLKIINKSGQIASADWAVGLHFCPAHNAKIVEYMICCTW